MLQVGVGWVHWQFSATKAVSSITVMQLNGWNMRTFEILVLQPDDSKWTSLKKYTGAAFTQTYTVPNGVMVDGVRIKMIGSAPRDSWARLLQIKVNGRDTIKTNSPPSPPTPSGYKPDGAAINLMRAAGTTCSVRASPPSLVYD